MNSAMNNVYALVYSNKQANGNEPTTPLIELNRVEDKRVPGHATCRRR